MESSHQAGESSIGESELPSLSCKVFIVDCHELTRIGLHYALQENPRYQIVAETDNVLSAIELIRQTKPDIVILDVVPLDHGINLSRTLKAEWPNLKIVMLVAEQDEHNIQLALSVGVDAYCLKTITSERLFQILDAIQKDAIWLDPGIAKKASQYATAPNYNLLRGPVNYGQMHLALTQREQEVLTLLTEGKSNKEIAYVLGISTHTVKTHVRNLIQKMAVEDRTQAVVKALQCGLIQHKELEDPMLEV